MPIRSFIALPLPRETVNALGDAAAKMAYQDKSNAVRWVDQANYHITLAFLGEQDEQSLQALAEHLDEHLPQTGLNIQATHFSPFPESRPKLIAAMIANTPELKELQHIVASSVLACGMELERRRFIPHLTLGRFRHSRNQFAGAIPTAIDLNAHVDEVAIFESILTPQGAEYEPIYRFALEFFDEEFASA